MAWRLDFGAASPPEQGVSMGIYAQFNKGLTRHVGCAASAGIETHSCYAGPERIQWCGADQPAPNLLFNAARHLLCGGHGSAFGCPRPNLQRDHARGHRRVVRQAQRGRARRIGGCAEFVDGGRALACGTGRNRSPGAKKTRRAPRACCASTPDRIDSSSRTRAWRPGPIDRSGGSG